ncbi:MAG TPA: hypothetical protein PK048_00540 [Candidatus Absconditabacterales bacterium]|nr:hypothetical protein [Candidatus Absconditabacterales bacterium]
MSNKSAHMSCPRCSTIAHVVKHGYLPSGKVRFRCTSCEVSYTSRRNKENIMENLPQRITEYGVRGTARLIGVVPSTILNRRKILNTHRIARIHKHTHSTTLQSEEIKSHRNRVYRG